MGNKTKRLNKKNSKDEIELRYSCDRSHLPRYQRTRTEPFQVPR